MEYNDNIANDLTFFVNLFFFCASLDVNCYDHINSKMCIFQKNGDNEKMRSFL